MKKKRLGLVILLAVIAATFSMAFLVGCGGGLDNNFLSGGANGVRIWNVTSIEGSDAEATGSITFTSVSVPVLGATRTYSAVGPAVSAVGVPLFGIGWSVSGGNINFGGTSISASRSGNNLILRNGGVTVTLTRA